MNLSVRANLNAPTFDEGELVMVKTHDKKEKMCVVVSTTIACVYERNDFFLVYSIEDKEKFVVIRNFMKKMG